MASDDFSAQQKQAVERMREMQKRSKISDNSYHKMPPTPPFVKLTSDFENPEPPYSKPDFESRGESSGQVKCLHQKPPKPLLDLPFINGLKFDKDLTLILGLILILANEKADRKLLLALLYIML